MLLIIIIVVDLFEFHMSTGDNTKIIFEQADEPYTPCRTPFAFRAIPMNQRRLYNDYPTCSKRTFGSRCSKVAGSLGNAVCLRQNYTVVVNIRQSSRKRLLLFLLSLSLSLSLSHSPFYSLLFFAYARTNIFLY